MFPLQTLWFITPEMHSTTSSSRGATSNKSSRIYPWPERSFWFFIINVPNRGNNYPHSWKTFQSWKLSIEILQTAIKENIAQLVGSIVKSLRRQLPTEKGSVPCLFTDSRCYRESVMQIPESDQVSVDISEISLTDRLLFPPHLSPAPPLAPDTRPPDHLSLASL